MSDGPKIRFTCKRSGNCCSRPGGFVRVDEADVARIAVHLDLSVDAVRSRYVDAARGLLKSGLGNRCVFLADGRYASCTIYPARPEKCRSWPFWDELLASPELLAEARRLCPGIDVEEPDDVWLSVIVPTLDEAALLEATLASVRAPGVECIVVDGGSVDRTVEIANARGAKVVRHRRGRALQMNAGAAIARGRVLMFLHADTLLPEGYSDAVAAACVHGHHDAGAFRLRLAGAGRLLRGIAALANLRSRLLRLPYGDQALFVRAATFRALGGYAEVASMEDFEFVRRLRKSGRRIEVLAAAVVTSARRWHERGILRNTLDNQRRILAFCWRRWRSAPQR